MENQNDNIVDVSGKQLSKEEVTKLLEKYGKQRASKIDQVAMSEALVGKVTIPRILDVVGDAASVERGASVAIAMMFNQQMDIDWFECKYREISDDNKIWEPVRAKLVKGLNGKKHSNPGQFVKRVREHGKGLRYGYPEQDENKPKEDGPKNRLPFDRVEQELGKLYKYLNNPSNNDAIQADPKVEQLKKANESITRTLRDDLGIDLNRYSNAD